MAVRTARPCSFADGAAYVEYDYDDTTGEVLRVRAVNDGPADLRVRIQGTNDSGEARGWQREWTFSAGSGESIVHIPPGQRKRFALMPDGGSPDPADRYPTLAGLATEVSYG